MITRRLSAERVIIFIILASGAFHVAALVLGSTVYSHWRWQHLPVHSALEVAGSFIALSVAYILWRLEQHGKGTQFNMPIAAALVGMGLLDGAHALAEPGQLFVWLHSNATFVGGLLFSLVWLPHRWHSAKLIWLAAGLSLCLSLFSVLAPQAVPVMVENGRFTVAAEFLNLAGGLLLLLAAVRLFLSYRQYRNIEDLLFVLHCSMFGAAAIMFEQSALWDLPWWGWHVLRLLAYGVALWFALAGEQLRQQIVETERESEAKQREYSDEQFERLYQYNASILQNLADAVIVIDSRGDIHTFSESAEQMFGYKSEQVVGKNIKFLMNDVDAQHHDDYMARYQPSKSSVAVGTTRDLYAKHACGRLFPVELTVSSLMSDEGMTFVGVMRDISERINHAKALEESAARALEASQSKSEFLANMSHEIRTPMNGIYGSLQILSAKTIDAESRELVKRALTSTKLLLTIINDILDFSKIEAGMLSFEEKAFDIYQVAENIISDLNANAVEKGLSLSLHPDSLLHRQWLGDTVRVRQVILNLVSNAIKFTHQGHVRIFLKSEHSTLIVVVQDTGIGMSEEAVTRLFTRFEQADKSTTRQYGGTGLGMAITQRLVELMQGRIEVQSQVDIGTTITVFLPLPEVAEQQTEAAVADDETSMPNCQGKRILVAEDNDINQLIVEELLTSTGAEVKIVANGEQAVDVASEESFDLVFMDIQMPVMDGMQATTALRGQGYSTPIVALTANVMADDVQRYSEQGFSDHLAKPIELSQLYATLHRWLGVP